MTTTRIHDGTLHITFTRAEKIAGLLRDQRIPLGAIGSVELVDDGLAATEGLRAPGLGLPGSVKLGTWRSAGARTLVAVRGHRPAVRIDLHGQHYSGVLLTVDEPGELVASLSQHAA